jgi:Fe(II)/alpha-ketoglutarate-dependent arginine beta-hydroxylase
VSVGTASRTAADGEIVRHLKLKPAEAACLRGVVTDVLDDYADVHDPRFLTDARRLTSRLPRQLHDFLTSFTAARGAVAGVVHGLPLEPMLGPTPPHWAATEGVAGNGQANACLCLAASTLGDVFAWGTLQRGKLVTDLVPIEGEEEVQSGHGTTLLAWHTEDAFHPRRCDHLMLLCLRNPGAVATTVSRLSPGDLPSEHLRTLAEPRFRIRPDPEHIRPESSLPHARPLRDSDARVSVLSGPATAPRLRIDPLFMELDPTDRAARAALDRVTDAIERNLIEIPLARGDLLVIDNRRAVHGRGSFSAAHDGGDRWIKRVMIIDRLAGRVARRHPHSRVLD